MIQTIYVHSVRELPTPACVLGRAFTRVSCLRSVRALKVKRLEVSAPKSVGQGHTTQRGYESKTVTAHDC